MLSVLLLLREAPAVTLSLQWEETLESGVVVQHYRASSPSTDVYVARVDLCADGVSIDATHPDDAGVTTGSWGESRAVQLATNGDFYTSGPQVYGDAVGWGVPWPRESTGLDQSGSWYYQDYGWIAFLHDGVVFTHSGLVKTNGTSKTGWMPDTKAPEPPPGTLALVSGFPELVIDGAPVTCSSPTASDCFPDRSDMRDRHPRTAMGLTEDEQTFLLVVVDGRTSTSTGMYGTELADVMDQLGAYVAFNLDGGGSSQMWSEAEGYLNDYSGNNSGSSARSVANHWGVLAGDSTRPGHCRDAEPCERIPAPGAILDDTSACAAVFGDPVWWREAEDGYEGHLLWTNAWEHDYAGNWAWWRLELDYAGDYAVSVWIDPDYGVHSTTRYTVVAGGTSTEVVIDQGAGDGWVDLGTYTFAAGGEQWVSVVDHESSSPGSNQHIVVDALRLERVGDPVDTGTPPDTGGEDTDTDPADTDTDPADTAPADSGPPDEAPGSRDAGETGCGCGGGTAAGGLWLAVALLSLRRRRTAATE
jgi:hypothetical protein